MKKHTNNQTTHGCHDMVSVDEAGTLPGLFQCRARRTPHSIAYRQYEPGKENWENYSWLQMKEKIDLWQTALMGEGLSPGDRVALYLKNSVEWVCCEQAALSLQLVVVPLYFLDTAKNIAFILQNSG
ncbi:MAG: AMP-binding protein, partial [Desulfobulbaceae bacterium]|nr:AMP-binding protein [Desulfobulbaceae bacterium]